MEKPWRSSQDPHHYSRRSTSVAGHMDAASLSTISLLHHHRAHHSMGPGQPSKSASPNYSYRDSDAFPIRVSLAQACTWQATSSVFLYSCTLSSFFLNSCPSLLGWNKASQKTTQSSLLWPPSSKAVPWELRLAHKECSQGQHFLAARLSFIAAHPISQAFQSDVLKCKRLAFLLFFF